MKLSSDLFDQLRSLTGLRMPEKAPSKRVLRQRAGSPYLLSTLRPSTYQLHREPATPQEEARLAAAEKRRHSRALRRARRAP